MISIREIAIGDAEAAARLSGEFGYPVETAVIEERIRRLTSLPDHAVFVACLDGSVVGWIAAGVVHHLQAEPTGEIGGFVVSNGLRSSGIGATHRFYLREGYGHTKTSAVFVKKL
jgi:predicted N-acetyltransferase YhbS